jgi:hypothetical protein
MADSITIHHQLSKEDYLQFGVYTSLNQPGAKKKRYQTLLFIWAAFVFVSLMLATKQFTSVLVINYIWPPLLASIYTAFIYHNQPAEIKKLHAEVYENPENRTFFAPAEIVFSEKGIDYSNEYAHTYLKWSGVVKKIEVNKCFYLYENSYQALIISKQNFENEEKLNTFRILIGKYLPLEADKAPITYKPFFGSKQRNIGPF